MFTLAIKGDLRKILDDEKKDLAGAVTRGVNAAAVAMRDDLRTQVKAAGLGDSVARAIRATVYPKGGRVSLRAAGQVYSKLVRKDPRYGRIDILDALSEARTITGRNGRWLAIPTDAARQIVGARISRRDLSPVNVEAAINQDLVFVRDPGSPLRAFLVISEGRVSQTGRIRAGFAKKRSNATTDVRNVVVFILVRQVRTAQKVDIAAAIRRAEADLQRRVQAQMARMRR
jgi:hypothetical protein